MSITIAVVPSAIPGDNRGALRELCAALSDILAMHVRCLHPETYSALVDELEKDRVQYAWMSPALMVMAGERIQLRPLLSAVRDNTAEYAAVMFVDAASPARTVNDLRGATVAWVDRTSAAGYLYPRLALAARGIDAAAWFGEELFLRSHAEVVRAVAEGRAHVGATYAQVPPDGLAIRRAGFLDAAPGWPARVLEWTGPIPNDVIAGHGLLDRAQHRVFGNAMLTLAERDDGRRLLWNAFNVERFVTTPRNTLQPLVEQVQRARAHGLLAQM